MSKLSEFGKTAKGLAKNPLGIIALFIVLIYGFASLVVGLSGQLERLERALLVGFLVVFPIMVLAVFAWLVSRHHTKLYAPTDFREDASFLAVDQRRSQFAASLSAATVQSLDPQEKEGLQLFDSELAALFAEKTVTPRTVEEAQQKRLLWVDDRPFNNVYERQALEALGFRIATSTSTDDALQKMEGQRYDLIISDMGRPPDDRAGYTLLSAVREFDRRIPFLIYAGSRKPEHQREARSRGAQGTTNRADELLKMVLDVTGIQQDTFSSG